MTPWQKIWIIIIAMQPLRLKYAQVLALASITSSLSSTREISSSSPFSFLMIAKIVKAIAAKIILAIIR